jgi:hypothetical protein
VPAILAENTTIYRQITLASFWAFIEDLAGKAMTMGKPSLLVEKEWVTCTRRSVCSVVESIHHIEMDVCNSRNVVIEKAEISLVEI